VTRLEARRILCGTSRQPVNSAPTLHVGGCDASDLSLCCRTKWIDGVGDVAVDNEVAWL